MRGDRRYTLQSEKGYGFHFPRGSRASSSQGPRRGQLTMLTAGRDHWGPQRLGTIVITDLTLTCLLLNHNNTEFYATEMKNSSK